MIVDDLFEVFYGTDLELNLLKKTKVGINFVSRTRRNNGVSAIVEPLKNVKPLDAGLITVAGGSSSVLSSFVQNKPFYSGRDILCLKPKKSMTLAEKLFYCICIKTNQYRYSFGRQANKTLKFIKLPEIPNWVKNYKIPKLNNISKPTIEKKINLTDRKWKHFTYDYLFTIERGRGAQIKDIRKNGKTPFITSTDKNNGLTGMVDILPTHQGNVITVNRIGSVSEAFYQSDSFCSTENVHVFIPKFKLNPYIAMFLICLIRSEKIKYSYGRTWSIERMNKTIMSLPIDDQDEPDWQFIENYIKSLPYSSNLQN